MKPRKPILVVYYSRTDNTARVAVEIATRLGADLERINDQKNRYGFWGYLRAVRDSQRELPAQIADIRKHPAEYALIVVGTPVWAQKMTPAIRAYLQITRGVLSEVAFFTTSGDTDCARVVPFMEALAGQKAIAFTGFNAGDLKSVVRFECKMTAFLRTLHSCGFWRDFAIDHRLSTSTGPVHDTQGTASGDGLR